MPFSNGSGVDFIEGLQDGLVKNRGSDMIHLVGLACAKCRTEDVNAGMITDGQMRQRNPNCPRCGGDGMVYRSPGLIRGIATNIRQQKNVHDVGLAMPGDMMFSTSPGWEECEAYTRKISAGDKFIATWPQPLEEGQTLVRAASQMSDNIRLSNNVMPTEDRLWYEPAGAIWCEDENDVTYDFGGDFTLGPGRVINWIGNSPNLGVKYTVKYTAYFEWIVWAPPQERTDRNRDLGSLVFLRKRHIAFVNDNPVITADDRIPVNIRVQC